MYKIIKLISFLIRSWLCYISIDNIPIIENPIANSILLEVISLYFILMISSRAIVGFFYKSGDAPTLGAIAYFFVYLVNLGIMYGILFCLTEIGVLPLSL